MGPVSVGNNQQDIVLYDGLCGFCNSAVQWVIHRDRSDRFRFAPQQSALATDILARHGIDCAGSMAANSIYLVLAPNSPREQLLSQSDVTVHILLTLGGASKVLGALLQAVPRFLRNFAYRLFARNRYRISRQHAACPVPTPAIRAKFLA